MARAVPWAAAIRGSGVVMWENLLELVACPTCHGKLRLNSPLEEGQIKTGNLQCEGCGTQFPVIGGVPRFVGSDGYVRSFSIEWTRFRTTQLDSARGWNLSENRFEQSLNFPIEELRGKLVLDAGCGMGRFGEIVAKHGGKVIGVDLSYAVDSAVKNLSRWKNAHVLQADLRELPFREGIFDFIYSLGVLHHTPDPRRAFESLIRFLRPGGKISVTLYSGYNRLYIRSTDLWRRVTTRLPRRLVYLLCRLAVPLYYLYRIPVLGPIGNLLWPISLHPDPEWRVLDTFDCYTPQCQFYHTHFEVYRWFLEAGLTEIAVLEPGVSFIGTRPVNVSVAR